jgi:hypothetical protein
MPSKYTMLASYSGFEQWCDITVDPETHTHQNSGVLDPESKDPYVFGPVGSGPIYVIICKDPDPDPSINKQKIKIYHFYCFVTFQKHVIYEDWC